jgi:hypothetical protein
VSVFVLVVFGLVVALMLSADPGAGEPDKEARGNEPGNEPGNDPDKKSEERQRRHRRGLILTGAASGSTIELIIWSGATGAAVLALLAFVFALVGGHEVLVGTFLAVSVFVLVVFGLVVALPLSAERGHEEPDTVPNKEPRVREPDRELRGEEPDEKSEGGWWRRRRDLILTAAASIAVSVALTASAKNVLKLGGKGEPGPTGNTGQKGPSGHTGHSGATGPSGLTGRAGTTGRPGVRGPTGRSGPTGPTGPASELAKTP